MVYVMSEVGFWKVVFGQFTFASRSGKLVAGNWVFGFIDSVTCPARGCRLQIGLICSTGCPLKRNIRHNGKIRIYQKQSLGLINDTQFYFVHTLLFCSTTLWGGQPKISKLYF